MQIVITREQIHALREWVEPVAVPFIYWIWKRGIDALKASLNEIITENVNRIRDELKELVKAELKEHQDSDDYQFAEIKRALHDPGGQK